MRDDWSKVYPRSEHPVIRTHPVIGRKLLFVNRIFTTRIVQLSQEESDTLLRMLFRTSRTRNSTAALNGGPGSIAFWDNCCTQHRAMWNYFPFRRYGHRVTICGDKPFFQPSLNEHESERAQPV